ncbi:hypothetical protein [Mycolicibacterium phlei]
MVTIHRVTVTSRRPFDDVLTDVYAGLGKVANFPAAVDYWSRQPDRHAFDAAVQLLTGPSGLIEFLSLDLGAAVKIRFPDKAFRMVRIIAGNPVTMSSMAVHTPDAGSYAQVTILVDERDGEVTLSYDSVASALAPYGSAEALRVAEDLDASVVALLRSAAG